ncbi:hypothetical protein BGX28_001174 [Mortierella sp. GBA30]|nr:hypothetical protein BGX28_001174 [Mortierella sp. GBA30]
MALPKGKKLIELGVAIPKILKNTEEDAIRILWLGWRLVWKYVSNARRGHYDVVSIHLNESCLASGTTESEEFMMAKEVLDNELNNA